MNTDTEIFSKDLKITVWHISQLCWENIWYVAEIISEKGHVYKTWILSEYNFRCLVGQTWQDKIKKIKVIQGNEAEFLSTNLISETVKSKLRQLL